MKYVYLKTMKKFMRPEVDINKQRVRIRERDDRGESIGKKFIRRKTHIEA